MDDNELTQAQKHNLEASGVNTSPPLVAVVQYDEGTKDAVLLFNNQTLKSGDSVNVRGKEYPTKFSVANVGNVPDEKNVDMPVQLIAVDKWDPIEQTIVSYMTPYWGPGIPARPFEEGIGYTVRIGDPVPVVAAVPNTMRPGRTVHDAVVHLTIGGVALKVDNIHGFGSRVVCKPNETSDGMAVTLRRWSFTVPWTVFGFAPVPKRGKPVEE